MILLVGGDMKIIAHGADAKLLEMMNDIGDEPDGWVAVCFAFSRLLEHYRSDHQLKIAVNLIKDLVDEQEGAVFLCDDSTIYVLVKDIARALVDKMIFQLRYLFMDDPLAYNEEGEENPEFSYTYILTRQYQDFRSLWISAFHWSFTRSKPSFFRSIWVKLRSVTPSRHTR